MAGRRRPDRAAAAAAVAVGVLLSSGLAGCTAEDRRQESADGTATQLVAALRTGDLSAAPITVPGQDEDPSAAYADTLGDLGPMLEAGDAQIAAGDARIEEDRAVVPLTWSWTIGGRDWRYRTSLTLRPEVDQSGEQVTDAEGRPQWQATYSPAWVHPDLAEGDALDLQELTADRGDIVGASGQPIVVERDVVRLGVDKTALDGASAAASARRIARIAQVDVPSYVQSVEAAGDSAFVPAITLRADEARAQIRRVERVQGGLAFADSEPLAPSADFAAPLIGRVGPVTAEILAESGGDVQAGDIVGLSGLQARYDSELRGQDGVVVRRESAGGDVRTLFDVQPVAGEPLRLTLDVDLQQRAQSILDSVPDSAGATALVAIRPSDGHVLAAASGQGADGLATATFGSEPPGSTFKIVSALALLRNGVEPGSRLDCPASVVVDGKTFTNYDDYPASATGRIDLAGALAQSCNTAFIGARDRIGEGDLAAAAAALGLGVDHAMGYPVFFGSVPAPESETEAAASLIGQGRVLASPVAMASVMASVQAGKAVLPVLVQGVDVQQTPPTAPLTRAEQKQLQTMLRGVVRNGSGQVLAGVGATGAKTGTAEFGEPGPGGSLPTHAWMVASRGDLAVAAYVERGDSGSGTAGPLLTAFLARG